MAVSKDQHKKKTFYICQGCSCELGREIWGSFLVGQLIGWLGMKTVGYICYLETHKKPPTPRVIKKLVQL